MAIEHLDLPPAPESGKLKLTAEEERNLRVVYKRSGQPNGPAAFVGLWDPEADYPDGHVSVPLTSTGARLGDIVTEGTSFANVEESSKDKKHVAGKSGSWIALIERIYKEAESDTGMPCDKKKVFAGYKDHLRECAAEKDTIHAACAEKSKSFKCGGTIVGGHVLIDATASAEVKPGANVTLVPICNCHNTYNATGVQDNAGVGYYMKLRCDVIPVVLSGYLQLP